MKVLQDMVVTFLEKRDKKNLLQKKEKTFLASFIS